MKHGNRMRSDKYVLDTNIWVSYIISKQTKFLLEIISENDIIIYSCDELKNELSEVLGYKHIVEKYSYNLNDALSFLKNASAYIQLQYPIRQYISNDAKDNYIIALALQTNSGFITSGDRHILTEKENLQKKFPKLRESRI